MSPVRLPSRRSTSSSSASKPTSASTPTPPHAPAAHAPSSGARARILGSRRVRVVAAAVVAVVAIVIALFATGVIGGTRDDVERVPYRDFMDAVSAGQVTSATIGDDAITFTVSGASAAGPDGEGDQARTLRTDNPDAPDLKERLLLAGVQVTSETSTSAVFDVLLDVLFLVIFVGGPCAALVRLASYSRTTFRIVRRTGVSFDDIAGMDELKRELGMVVDVLRHPEAYARRGIRPVKGVILEGPPGNGKTYFARALATEAGVNFIATKGADFQSALMSMGARKIRMLFRKAARHTPCIVFIDEFDAIGERRNYAGTGIDKENNRIITAMLNEMDGFASGSGVLVIAATNSYRSLDPALIRPGRFDLKFTVSNPDAATRERLVALCLRGKRVSLAADVTTQGLVDAFAGLSCAAIETCLNGAATIAEARGAAGTGAGAGGSRASGAARASGASGDVAGAITWDDVREAARKADVRLAGTAGATTRA